MVAVLGLIFFKIWLILIVKGVFPVPPTYILPTQILLIFWYFFRVLKLNIKLFKMNGIVKGNNKYDKIFGLL